MDGDTDFPTICGTGSEDYVGLSYGMQQTPYLYNGCSLDEKNFVSMYRWHLPDPIYLAKRVPHHDSADCLEGRPGRDAGRLVVRNVLVRAGAEPAAAADAGCQSPHG